MDREPVSALTNLCYPGEFDRFFKYDVLDDRSYPLPFAILAVPEPRPYASDCISLRQFGWNMMRDEKDEVLVGSVADMEAHIEVRWVTSIEGAGCQQR